MAATTFDSEVAEARKRVMSFDEGDGFNDRGLLTILFALEAGLRHPETGAQYDAYVMLRDVACEDKTRSTS